MMDWEVPVLPAPRRVVVLISAHYKNQNDYGYAK